MTLREQWKELDTGLQIVVGLGVGAAVLLIAIPVILILAAVVASFVLGMGGPEAGAPETPQVSFEFDTADDLSSATITHDGGDTIQADRLTISIGDRSTGWAGAEEVSAGVSTTVETQPGDTITLVWRGEEESATLARFDVPDS
jgi:FlaG/FlaF family flagellin (archaellin)